MQVSEKGKIRSAVERKSTTSNAGHTSRDCRITPRTALAASCLYGYSGKSNEASNSYNCKRVVFADVNNSEEMRKKKENTHQENTIIIENILPRF